MDISKLVEDGARALALQEHSAKGVAQIWDNDLQPERGNYESAARAVLAIALAAAAEEALQFMVQNIKAATRAKIRAARQRKLGDIFGHGETAEIRAMECDAAAKEAEAIADRLHTLATQLGAANG